MDISVYDKNNPLDQFSEEDVVQFLYKALERFGDPKTDIQRCLNYALENISSFGGKVIIASENKKIGGAVIINNTGMKGYIPEHILVYIAVGPDQRGKGLGKMLMNKAAEVTEGDIALHVEDDNPALHLYEKVGYENKYLEMRLSK
ncbi:MAG: GNAT family N-acetyltransferase [Bacteroidota bacterium]